MQVIYSLLLVAYALGVVFLTRWFHSAMVRKGMSSNTALYYVRKMVHILAGGAVGVLVPIACRDERFVNRYRYRLLNVAPLCSRASP